MKSRIKSNPSSDNRSYFAVILLIAVQLWQTGTMVSAQTITGVSFPQMAAFDNAMLSVMNEFDFPEGILAISRKGCVVYQRGFQTYTAEYIFPENTPMRLASVEKPIAAAVIRELAADGFLGLDDFVFEMPRRVAGRSLLPAANYYPYTGRFGDSRLADITVRHLLLHQGGWDIWLLDEQNDITGDPDFFDPQMECIRIADKMDIDSPPGRVNTVRYMLSQPLQFAPGTPANMYAGTQYSNFGYMLLGLIIEELTGMNVATQVRLRLVPPSIWVPSTEIFTGRTFQTEMDPREPPYRAPKIKPNVFDPGEDVQHPYGGWDHWALQGHGNLVSGAVPLLRFLDRYYIRGDSIGMPIFPFRGVFSFGGGLPGTSTIIRQRPDSINIVILFNTRNDSGTGVAIDRITNIIDDPNNPIDWPDMCVDGFWIDFETLYTGFGGYNDPFRTMDKALVNVSDGSKLRIKPGTTNWTGTISTKLLIDAPMGYAIVGEQ